MSLLVMSQQYRERPSKLIGLVNDYEAFCFDEACAYIKDKLQEEDGPKPRFTNEEKPNNNKEAIEFFKSHNQIR